jgi:uncharacterized protein (TIGR03437 family)
VAVDPAIPEIFSNADGSAITLNQDGSVNSLGNPAKVGSIVLFWATGTGAYFGAIDGQIQSGPGSTCNCSMAPQGDVTLLYAGAAPGTVSGITQFNVKVLFPVFQLAVVVGGKEGDSVPLYVAP